MLESRWNQASKQKKSFRFLGKWNGIIDFLSSCLNIESFLYGIHDMVQKLLNPITPQLHASSTCKKIMFAL
jgi:hypothetical protein